PRTRWWIRSRTGHDAHGVGRSYWSGVTFARTPRVTAKVRARFSVLIAVQPRADGSPAAVAPVRTLHGVPDDEHRHRNVGEGMLDGLSRLGMLGLLLAPVAVVAWAVRKVRHRPPSSG